MGDGGEGLLSDELRAQLGGGDVLMLKKSGKKAKGGGGGNFGMSRPDGRARGNFVLPRDKKMSKSQRRKLAKVEEDKRKREERAAVVARLEAAKLVTDESLTLLAGSARLGHKLTAKEKLRRELKAERAGITLPGTEDSRLHKREKKKTDDDSCGDDSRDEVGTSDDDEPIDPEPPTKAKASWPKLMTHDGSTKTAPVDEYGPIHPMDTARLEAARLAQAEALVMAQDDSDDESREEQTAEDAAAREAFRLAMVTMARELQRAIRARDPAQAAEAATEALGPEAVAAALDPTDANARLAAANEAARVAAAKKFPGVFVGATHPVEVRRDRRIQAAREGLPILGSEHDIVDQINHNPVTVICGETGCGKTTQVPQFLYESGYGDPECAAHPGAVAVTQPRRVAVTSTATRVAQELNVPLGGDVGYQVRYDKKVGEEPRIKFMTDGILLREIQSDLLLRKYSVVIVDEAHERSVNTDILLGLLSRVVPLRAELAGEGTGITPLRLVVMSATLRVEEFVGNKRLCPTPPALLKVAARQFPVTIHFARRTEHLDYLGAAKKKVLAIHRKLPPGGILVFLTGQREVDGLVRKLSEGEFGPRDPTKADDKKADDEETEERELDPHDVDALDAGGEDLGVDEDERDLQDFEGKDDFDEMSDHDDSASDISEDEDDVVVHGGEGVTPEEAAKAEDEWIRAHAPTVEAGGGGNRNDDGDGNNEEKDDGPGPMHVLPLYAMLPPHRQARVFDPPPPGHRLVVIATNVAETSLTIPGVRYVVDAGREKRRVFGDDATGGGGGGAASAGLSRFTVGWISKASAEQRAGRAGRTGPGHCYRLFSSAHFVNDLDPHAPPAILGVPVDGVFLQMRAMGIDRIDRFPFITPPNAASLATAQRTLAILGALRATSAGSGRRMTHGHGGSFGDDRDPGELTDVGRAMAALPISPRHARMLLAAASSTAPGCLAAAVASAAALSLQSPFLGEESERSLPADMSEEERKRRRKLAHKFHHHNSDALSAAKALVAYDKVRDHRKQETFCDEHRLHSRTMREMSDLRRQLLRILTTPPPSVAGAAASKDSFLPQHAVAAIAEATAAINRKVRGPDDASDKTKDPASVALEPGSPGDVALRRALLRGWADRVARRAKADEAARLNAAADKDEDGGDGGGGRTKATRYRPAMLDLAVFLHPTSTLHRTSPDYVVYVDLLQTAKRPYLAGATAVEASWLVDDAPALAYLSSALEDPAPRYVAAKDSVVAFHQPHFGKHRWELPLWPDALGADNPSACGAFAAALLSGAVSTPMGDLRDRLAAKPSVCARPEGRSQRRVVELVASLQRRGVATRAALAEQWRRDPRFLLPEMMGWMKSGQGYALEKLWPRIVASAARDAAAKMAEAAAPPAEHRGVEHRKKREAERSAGGAGAGRPESAKRSAKKQKKVKGNSKALGSGLSIWD